MPEVPQTTCRRPKHGSRRLRSGSRRPMRRTYNRCTPQSICSCAAQVSTGQNRTGCSISGLSWGARAPFRSKIAILQFTGTIPLSIIHPIISCSAGKSSIFAFFSGNNFSGLQNLLQNPEIPYNSQMVFCRFKKKYPKFTISGCIL